MLNTLKKLFIDLKDEIFIYDSIAQKNYTYSEFLSIAYAYYTFINNNKNDNDNRVAILLDNSIDMLSIYLACLFSGSVAMPIDTHGGSSYINNILQENKHNIIIKEKIEYNINNNFKDIAKIIDSIDTEKIFLITFTSGTTGKSKGVIHSFANLYKSAEAFAKKLGYNNSSIFYHNLPMAYMAGILNQFIMPFISQSKIVLGNRFNIREILNFWETPVKYKCNVLWLNPTIIALLNQMDRSTAGIDYLAKNNITISVGTAPLFENVKNTFEQKYNTPLYRSYGLSETLFITTQNKNIINMELSNGEILDGVSLELGENQEVLISTPWNFLGYTGIEANNKDVFHSGDCGYIDNGQLFITGRIKDLIIRGGFNVSPITLANFLISKNIFDDVAVIGCQDNILTEKIVCFYVCNNHINIETLNSSIIEALGSNYKVDEYIKIDEIPRNINGKINHNALKEIYVNRY